MQICIAVDVQRKFFYYKDAESGPFGINKNRNLPFVVDDFSLHHCDKMTSSEN